MRLRAYLVLLVVGALLPIVVFAGWLVVVVARQQKDAVESGLRDAARTLRVAVDADLLARLATLEALAASEPLASGDLPAFSRLAARVLAARSGGTTVVLAEPSGRPVLHGGGPRTARRPAPGGADLVDAVARTGRPAVSNLLADPAGGPPVVGVAVPVWRDGTLRYVLAAMLEPSGLVGVLPPASLPPGGVASLVDRRGIYVARSRDGQGVVGQPLGEARGARLTGAPEGALEEVDEAGRPRYGAFSRSALSGWTVAVDVPAEGVDAALRRSLARLAGGGLLLVGLGAGLAVLVGRRLATSIASLGEAAAALGHDRTLPAGAALPVREVTDLRDALEGAAVLLDARTREGRQAEERRGEIEADLRRANEAKDEFLAMLGHELRNPIAAIRNAVSALEPAATHGGGLARLRAIIERQAAHLARLVDDLLDVSRVTSGKITLHRQPVDLTEVVRRALEALRQAGRLDRHDVGSDGEPVMVDGDPMRLEQVVSNLVENAVKYTPPGGIIRVAVSPEGAEAVLRVTDTGVGIEPEMLTRIFDLFTQGERPLHRLPGGLGVGLTLVRRLTELHDGTVSVSSGGRGQGSEFVVRLPLLSGAPPVAEPAPAHPDRRLRVLVVEDNADARDALRLLLEAWGHQVDDAPDGTRGVKVALAAPPDVAFIDIGLPGLDGYTVARRLRATPAGRDVFLVALTGYGQPADRRRALAAGFDAHLVKPVDPEALAGVLGRAAREVAASR
jgi:signal transduction histidine kinase/ActR/RegA family two-component response regulator